MNSRYLLSAFSIGLVMMLGACSKKDAAPESAPAPAAATEPAPMPEAPPVADEAKPEASAAVVHLAPTEGNSVTGEITLTPADGGVKVAGTVSGLEPNSEHGFHIHENGDCSAPDASSAGGHFNPTGAEHGSMDAEPHQAGDMPNIKADDTGAATVDVVVPGIELGTGSATDVMGKAIVVHADPDDYKSQPAGNAGARLACGVISPEQ